MPVSGKGQNTGGAVPAAGGTYQPMDSGSDFNPFGSALDIKKKQKAAEREKSKWKKAEKIKITPRKKEEPEQSIQPNQPNEKKKSHSSRKWLWVLAGVLGVTIFIVVIWTVVTLVRDKQALQTADNPQDVTSDYFQQLKDKAGITDTGTDGEGSLEDAQQAVKDTLDTEEGQKNKNQLKLAEAMIMLQSQDYQKAKDTINEVNVESLDTADASLFYSVMASIYLNEGNIEMYNQYLQLEQEKSFEYNQETGI